MKKLMYRILLYLKIILILWLPILLIEETFLLDFIRPDGSLMCSILLFIICLIIYIKIYKKEVKDKNIKGYCYNIINTIVLGIINIVLGCIFIYLVDIKFFHYCKASGWDCFLYGVEYWLIGIEYALLSAIVLIIWLIVRLIKFLSNKFKNN